MLRNKRENFNLTNLTIQGDWEMQTAILSSFCIGTPCIYYCDLMPTVPVLHMQFLCYTAWTIHKKSEKWVLHEPSTLNKNNY